MCPNNSDSGDKDRAHESKEPVFVTNTMDGHQFESLVERLLVKMGFAIEGRQAAADGGIDMIAVKADLITGGKYIIQCKRYSGSVGSPPVRDLYGVVHSEAASKGVLITNSTFTRDAIRFAENKPIELIDGTKLEGLLLEHGLLNASPTSDRLRPTPGIQTLYTQLVGPFERIVNESQRVADGLIFLPRRTVDEAAYQKLALRHLDQLSGVIDTLPTLVQPIARTLNDYHPSAADLETLRNHVKEFLTMSRTLVKIQKESESILPPPTLEQVHKHFVRIAPALLERVAPLPALIRGIVETGDPGIAQDLNLDLHVPELDLTLSALLTVSAFSSPSAQSKCFIATAVFESSVHPDVIALRRFRDHHLVGTRMGDGFIALYESLSPPIARVLARRKLLRSIVQAILIPIVHAARSANTRRN